MYKTDFNKPLDELRLPFVHPLVIEYLEHIFGLNSVVTNSALSNNDERIGYAKGTMDVINTIKLVNKR